MQWTPAGDDLSNTKVGGPLADPVSHQLSCLFCTTVCADSQEAGEIVQVNSDARLALIWLEVNPVVKINQEVRMQQQVAYLRELFPN